MIVLTYNDNKIDCNDKILLLSDKLISQQLTYINQKVFDVFKIWITDLMNEGIKFYGNFDLGVVIFKPVIFKNCDILTLIDIYNFGVNYEIYLLVDTIAYIIASRNILISDLNDKYYTSNSLIEKDGEIFYSSVNLSYNLVIDVLRLMTKQNFDLQPINIKCMLEYKEIDVFEYKPYLNDVNELNVHIHRYNPDTFEGYDNSKFILIPYSITTIERYAFSYFEYAEYVDIPYSVTEIGKEAFIGCNTLKCVDIPNSVEILDSGAFINCSSLENIKVSDTLEYLGNNLFGGCDKLEFSYKNILYKVPCDISEYTIPNNIIKIDDYAFYNCNNIKSLVIPSNVMSIGHKSFYKCFKLTDVKIENPNLNILQSSFYKCGFKPEL